MCRILSRPLFLWHKRLLGGRVEAVENNPNSIQAGILLTLSDWSTPWAAAGSTAPVWSACMYRPLALQHSRTWTVSFSPCCYFETYRDFDIAIERKSRQANKECYNTAASPCGPAQSRKLCVTHWKVWDHSPYSQQLYHVTPYVWSHQEGIWGL
jgi:hypothetical protein